MNFNIHPAFVHFPIAFFFLYSLFELGTLTPLKKFPHWLWIKATLVIIGTLSALVTLQTGEIAEHLVRSASNRNLIEVHNVVASFTTYLFVVLALAYACELFLESDLKDHARLKMMKPAHPWMQRYVNLILKTPLVYILAIVGLVGITVAGALGGAIVYGPDTDPVVHFIYGLFIGN